MKYRWLIGILALVALGAGVFYFTSTAEEEGSGDSPAAAANPGGGGDANARPVRTIAVLPQSLDRELRLTGTLRADEAIEVRSEISAVVRRITFTEGERVEEGDLLVQLDNAELIAEREQVQAELDLARREETRQARLLGEGSTSERVHDEAVNRVRILEARLIGIQARLEKTEIHAPFAGVIGLREVSPGSFLRSETRVASLHRIEPIKIDFAVPERHLPDLRENPTFTVMVAGDERRYSGHVYAREPSVDPTTRTVSMRGIIEETEGALLPGAFAQVVLSLGRDEEILLVPAVAVVPGRESAVFVVENGTARRRSVELGRRTRDQVEIRSGLEPGDHVVIAGVQNIRDGQSVQVIQHESEPVAAR